LHPRQKSYNPLNIHLFEKQAEFQSMMEGPGCLRELPLGAIKLNRIPSQPFPLQQIAANEIAS